ncbi:MAG: CpsD/CapB family tyrosine-protein kinase [Planctomycetales bacterium]|nr:CpsD/CapB family tyrosine-protein kinase [Planctomycetales bacterium]
MTSAIVDTNTTGFNFSAPSIPSEVATHYLSLLERLGPEKNAPGFAVPTVGLTSCYSGEGVSTVAANLAITAATTSNRDVLLVDANFARPSLRRAFQTPPGPGLAEILLEDRQWGSGVQPSSFPRLSLMTTGTRPADFAQAFDSDALGPVVDQLREAFDLVVFDLPPAGQVACCTRFARLLDGVLLIVEAERVRREVALRTTELLRRGNVHLLGAVMNKQIQHVPDWLYRTL